MENIVPLENSKGKTPAIIDIRRITHPDNRHDFRAVAVSKSERREIKHALSYVCGMCGIGQKDGAKHKKCARCQNVMYCSKECQVKDWPNHKPNCRKIDHSKQKLIVNVITNTHLLLYIQLALALLFELNKKPRPEEPLVAHCELAVEPSDLMYIPLFVTGGITAEDAQKGTEGMIQVREINVQDPSKVLDHPRMEMWRTAKKNLKEGDKPNEHVVVLYCYLAGIDQGRSFTVHIPEPVIERVKSGIGFERKSGIFGTTTIPLSINSCLDGINSHIRSDKHNKLQLRVHLTHEEVKEHIEQLSHSIA